MAWITNANEWYTWSIHQFQQNDGYEEKKKSEKGEKAKLGVAEANVLVTRVAED